ncbi:MAG: hypothetical protein KDB22_15845 [Planctomycetales bacterium]|nr:hypothetical protein [Planctomycetales bacterium]
MNRLSVFLLGMLAGAALLYTSENYYIVRANEGIHIVPKLAGKVEFPYRDIRNYTVEDWKRNVSLGAAIVKAKKPDLMVESLTSVRTNFDNILQSLGGN